MKVKAWNVVIETNEMLSVTQTINA